MRMDRVGEHHSSKWRIKSPPAVQPEELTSPGERGSKRSQGAADEGQAARAAAGDSSVALSCPSLRLHAYSIEGMTTIRNGGATVTCIVMDNKEPPNLTTSVSRNGGYSTGTSLEEEIQDEKLSPSKIMRFFSTPRKRANSSTDRPRSLILMGNSSTWNALSSIRKMGSFKKLKSPTAPKPQSPSVEKVKCNMDFQCPDHHSTLSLSSMESEERGEVAGLKMGRNPVCFQDAVQTVYYDDGNEDSGISSHSQLSLNLAPGAEEKKEELQEAPSEHQAALLCWAGDGALAQAVQRGCGVSSLGSSKSRLDVGLGSLLWVSVLGRGGTRGLQGLLPTSATL
ncbi:hypothetical protein LUU34_00047900 [Aix galericulata]|nr:hypothetical protein LUU34_00047900 [Aix galericulata]